MHVCKSLLSSCLLVIAVGGCATSPSDTSAEPSDEKKADDEDSEPLFSEYDPLPEGGSLEDSEVLPTEPGFTLGSDRAPVTIVAFIDEDTLAEPGSYALARGIEARAEDKVRVVVYPIFSKGGASEGALPDDPLARALIAAGRQDAYWEFEELAFDEREAWEEAIEREERTAALEEIDDLEEELKRASEEGDNDEVMMLKHQLSQRERVVRREGSDTEGPTPDELFESWAEHLELDLEKFDDDRTSEETERRLLANTLRARRLSAHDAGLFINGRFMAQDGPAFGSDSPMAVYRGVELREKSSELMGRVEEAFEQAESFREEGGEPDRLYADLVRRNVRAHPESEDPRTRREEDRVAALPIYDGDNDRISGGWSGTERKVARDPAIGAREDYLATVVLACDPNVSICAGGIERIKQLEETFGDRVRFVYKSKRSLGSSHPGRGRRTWNYPAVLAAAEQLGAYPEMHRAVGEAVADQEDLSLDELAQRAGLEADELREAVESSKVANLLDQNRMMLEQAADLVSGPVLFVNGIAVEGQFATNGIERVGIPPREYLEELLEEQLELAEHVRDRTGDISDVELYSTLVELNREAPPEVPTFDLEFDVDTDALDVEQMPAYGPEEADVEVVAFHGFGDGRSARAHHTFQAALDDFSGEVRLHWVYRPREDSEPSVTTLLTAKAAIAAARTDHFEDAYRALLDYRFLGAPGEWPRFVRRRADLDLSKIGSSIGDDEARQWRDDTQEMAEEAGAYTAPLYLIGDEVVAGNAPLGEYIDALEAAAQDDDS